MKALLGKLLIIQKAIDGIAKSEKGFNYSYAGQEQVLNTIRPLMNDNGLLLMQEVVSVENTRIDYKNAKGYEKSEILTSASQLFTWIDCETAETLECRFHANGMNDWEKGLGSALTYAERYFLLKFFHIPTPNDDPDARQAPPQQVPAKAQKREPKAQAELVTREHVDTDNISLELECCTTQPQLDDLWKKLSKPEQTLHQKAFTTKKGLISK